MVEIVWKRGAEDDLLGIFPSWKNSGMGQAVGSPSTSMARCIRLRSHPQMAPVYEPPVRRLVVGNSGYGLFYTVEPRGIIVHALVHLSQNPETIRDRIRRSLGLS